MIKTMRARDIDILRFTGESQAIDPAVESTVEEIIDDVRRRGDLALIDYTHKFDGVLLNSISVDPEDIRRAYDRTDPALISSLNGAAENIRAFHARQSQGGYNMTGPDGVVIGQRVIPLGRVGVYIPGGTASYPSSVLMNVIPARIAGVGDIIMVSPPGPDGTIPDQILAAAYIAGATRVFMVGGAQAVAALAYGTESIPKVDKIVGPGNIYVATAKRRVYGRVDIDMIAGPSEILIIADSTADARFVAADMLSQAEHDALAASILVTDDAALAEKVTVEVESMLAGLERSDIARASIENNGAILLTENMDEATALANAIAPEHLELCVADPFGMLGAIVNAGSVFLGHFSPEPVGDYWAGPNHTLPTGGTARFSSPLSVEDFVKKSSFIYYTERALRAAARDIALIARSEGLCAHARAVEVRAEEGMAE